MQETSIEWTQKKGIRGMTWNPTRGCKKVDRECKNCYADAFAKRFEGTPGHAYEHGFKPRLVPEQLEEPLRKTESRMVFGDSMSDLFYKEFPDEYIKDVVDVMMMANWHIYVILTKRSERMRDMLRGPLKDAAKVRHIWWGVSCGDREHGVPRIQHLKDSGAQVKVVSFEPLLEYLGRINLRGIDWAIVGGESGRNGDLIEMPVRAVNAIHKQCMDLMIPFHFKQWGGRNKKKAGRLLNGRTYDEMPEVAFNPVPPFKIRQEMIAKVRTRIARWMPFDNIPLQSLGLGRLEKTGAGQKDHANKATWDEKPMGVAFSE